MGTDMESVGVRKDEYTVPVVKRIGTFEDITQANGPAIVYDVNTFGMPVGTPLSTFS
jgi:hypothetical protein